MRVRYLIPLALVAAGFFTAPPLPAADAATTSSISESDLKPGITQPYIVKKGDTLWDIANYFFKDPEKWLKIWEHNLYITNPDLIYPGNKLWFDGRMQAQGGLTSERPHPQIQDKPVERLGGNLDTKLLLTAMQRQDFIEPEAVQGVGHILDAEDERLNFGRGDRLYLKLQAPAESGDVFDVFRTGDPVRDPATHKVVGVLINHLGQVEITGQSQGIYKGVVLNAFEEISRGDRLKPARKIDPNVKPSYPPADIRGTIIFIRGHATEAGQQQVVGIDLGTNAGMQPGTVLSIYRTGRVIRDKVDGSTVRLPDKKSGELIVMSPQPNASMALITQSTDPIHLGDTVGNLGDNP